MMMMSACNEQWQGLAAELPRDLVGDLRPCERAILCMLIVHKEFVSVDWVLVGFG